MEERVFLDKSAQPTKQMLEEALGKSLKYWLDIKSSLEAEYGALTEEWKFYSSASGWTMKLLYKKRNLFFFSPLKNYFRIAFVFGDKAVAAVEQSSLPQNIIDELVNAKKYTEGRGLRIEIKTKAEAEYVKQLVKIKLSN